MLNDPDAANLVNGRWAPRGSAAADLVDHLDQGGLRFGPPTPAPAPR